MYVCVRVCVCMFDHSATAVVLVNFQFSVMHNVLDIDQKLNDLYQFSLIRLQKLGSISRWKWTRVNVLLSHRSALRSAAFPSTVAFDRSPGLTTTEYSCVSERLADILSKSQSRAQREDSGRDCPPGVTKKIGPGKK